MVRDQLGQPWSKINSDFTVQEHLRQPCPSNFCWQCHRSFTLSTHLFQFLQPNTSSKSHALKFPTSLNLI
ncbi:hypothetical protein CROQUDRAFT_650138 [Cronartium quercuum f. sp. fusiforme G11]|uniref:Uncharacterized protein n=1 Tax=Cronartium quercuum f. sp. fusiforme G11 TaxID=708437 RepID=A0A9P6THH6_9BASI|nr:hypothetical protein CROQUDRAFT_650138 [Cronartium quercuum f. sp. fusiforme G11]